MLLSFADQTGSCQQKPSQSWKGSGSKEDSRWVESEAQTSEQFKFRGSIRETLGPFLLVQENGPPILAFTHLKTVCDHRERSNSRFFERRNMIDHRSPEKRTFPSGSFLSLSKGRRKNFSMQVKLWSWSGHMTRNRAKAGSKFSQNERLQNPSTKLGPHVDFLVFQRHSTWF